MMWIFDCLVFGLLLFCAWRSLYADSLFSCIVAFISFGLVMAIAWLRLGAPDVALAEAAVGAGVTGSLLLATLGRLRKVKEHLHEGRER